MSQQVKLNAWDLGHLERHLDFYQALESGERKPTTTAQRHFVAVCRGRERPRTQHEIAFWRYRRLRTVTTPTAASRSMIRIHRPPSSKAVEIVERIEKLQFEEPIRPKRRDTLDRLKLLYVEGRAKAADLSTDAAFWTSTLLSAPDFSRSLEGWLSHAYGGVSTAYAQATDGSYARDGLQAGSDYVSPWLHRLFEGHTPSRAWEAVREALPDDTRAQEFVGFVTSFSSDLASRVGIPVVQLSLDQYEVIRQLS